MSRPRSPARAVPVASDLEVLNALVGADQRGVDRNRVASSVDDVDAVLEEAARLEAS